MGQLIFLLSFVLLWFVLSLLQVNVLEFRFLHLLRRVIEANLRREIENNRHVNHTLYFSTHADTCNAHVHTHTSNHELMTNLHLPVITGLLSFTPGRKPSCVTMATFMKLREH